MTLDELPWPRIETVFLDMDGTLLDLHFDNHFWQEHLPRHYARRHGLTLDDAKALLEPRFAAAEGTLAWYCLDHWARTLDVDLVPLKEEVAHLIALHPHAAAFLRALRRSGRRAVLVTNAHPDSLALKLGHTRLARLLDRIVCAHHLGLPKETPDFWQRLQAVEPCSPAATLLVDDNPAVLRAAQAHGIAHLLAVARPDRRRPPRAVPGFPALRHFRLRRPLPPLRGRAQRSQRLKRLRQYRSRLS